MNIKEKKRAIVASILAAVFVVLMIVGSIPAGGNAEKGEYSNRPITLKVNYYAGGYGKQWIEQVAQDYMDNYNEDVYVKLTASSDNSVTNANIRSGYADYDLYQIEVGMFEMEDKLYDLTDEVYNKNTIGDTTEIVCKDKISEKDLERYSEKGRYYQLPQTSGLGWNWVLNLDTINEAFGEGNWSIPRTTDELFAFGDACIEKGIFLTCGAFADTTGGDYLKYAFQCWFGQMVGEDGYNQFFDGNYLNDDGEYVLAEDHPYMFTQRKNEMEAVYSLAYRLCDNNRDGFYMYTNSDSLNYKMADKVLYGGGYGKNKAKIAMLYTGAWIETEVNDFIEDGIITRQNFKAIRMPIISDIITKTPSIPNDGKLAEVVDYVDGIVEQRPEGVTDADIEIIREARSMVAENICRQFVVPKRSSRAKEACEFLRYLMSDRAQKISTNLANGVNQLPYGYSPLNDADVDFSEFIKSVYEINKNAIIIDYGLQYKTFKLTVGMQYYYDQYTYGNVLPVGMYSGRSTQPEKIYQETYKYFDSRWNTLMTTYKAKVGLL